MMKDLRVNSALAARFTGRRLGQFLCRELGTGLLILLLMSWAWADAPSIGVPSERPSDAVSGTAKNITGRVRNADHSPAVGARIVNGSHTKYSWDPKFGGEEAPLAETDEAGVFTLTDVPDLLSTVFVLTASGISARVPVGHFPDWTIDLPLPSTAAGQVTLENGTPLENCKVRLYQTPVDAMHSYVIWKETLTDIKGAYQFSDLGSGKANIEVHACGGVLA